MTASSTGGLPFKIQLDVKVPMSDGVKLSADLYMPLKGGPFPALLLHTPYNNQEESYVMNYAKPFVEAGYAVVLLDSRGRHDSEGEWYAYVNEGKDGYEAHEWIGGQPWCSGKVGTFGISYPGGTQIWAAPYHSRYLKALVPTAAQVDNHISMAYTDGGTFHPTWGIWFVTMAGHTMQGGSGKLIDSLELMRRLPLISALDDICDQPAYRDAIRHYTHDSHWKSYGVLDKFNQIDAPAYFITGWYDNLVHDNFKMINGWRSKARSEEARKFTKLVVGPWSHGTLGSSQVFGDITFGNNMEVDLVAEHIRWYDRRLKGVDNGIDDEPPIKIFVMGDNVWRYENEWPLARAQHVDYYLHSGGRANSLHGDGLLDRKPPTTEAPDHYSYDPNDPVPTIGGHDHNGGAYAGPRDRRPAERRDDVLVYTTKTLSSDIEVTGPITAILFSASSAPDTDFAAALVDLHPDGKAINITQGILRARFRDFLENPTLIEPGKVYAYKIGVWETSNVFKAGHRIRVEISSSDWPNHDRNLNTGHQPGMDAELRIAEQTIYHDSANPSRITLPIVPGNE